MWRMPRRIDEAVERDRAPRLDGGDEVADRGLAVAVAVAQRRQRLLVPGQAEDVGRLLDQALVEEGLQLLDRPAPRCRRRGARRSGSGARCAGTGRRTRRCSGGSRRGSVALGVAPWSSRASGVCSGHGQWVGNANGSAPAGRSSRHDADDLRDHVAGALDDHGVADADVLAGDLVGVVQGGVLDHHAADRDRASAARPGSPRRCGRPGCRWRSRMVRACSAGNLRAIAQRGERETKPSRRCQSSRSTL